MPRHQHEYTALVGLGVTYLSIIVNAISGRCKILEWGEVGGMVRRVWIGGCARVLSPQKFNKEFELMLTRCVKANSSSGSVISLKIGVFTLS